MSALTTVCFYFYHDIEVARDILHMILLQYNMYIYIIWVNYNDVTVLPHWNHG